MSRSIAPPGDAFERAVVSLPRALASARAQAAVLRIVRRVPVAASTFGFECRLDAEDDRVDFGAALRPDFLADLPGPSALLRSDPIWRRLSALGRAWSAGGSLLERWVPFLFLEFDEGCPLVPLPAPSVFIALDSPLERGAALDVRDGPLAALGAAVELLRRRAVPASLSRRVSEVVESLPADAHLIHAGVLLARRARGLRLSLALRPDALEPALDRLGIGASPIAARAVRELASMTSGFQLDCDFRPAPARAFGLGLRPNHQRHWSALCAWTVEQGWCSAPKARALLRWREGAALAGNRSASSLRLERMLSHLKLTVSATGDVGAKAYLGYAARPA